VEHFCRLILCVGVGWGLIGCVTYKKTCDNDGVCTVVKDGVTTYEGPPEKIAALKKRKMVQAKKESALVKDIQSLPKRAPEEVVRVGFVGVDLEPVYVNMMAEEILKVGNYAIIDPNLVLQGFSEGSSDSHYPGSFATSNSRPPVALPFELATFLKARRQGAVADVFVLLTAKNHGTVGSFQGSSLKKGTLGSIDTLKFSIKASSAFVQKPVEFAAVGKSYTQLDAVGYEKGKKTGQGTISAGQRNSELDREAIQKLVQSLHKAIESEIKSGLPSYAKLVELENKNRTPAAAKPKNINDKETQQELQKAVADQFKNWMNKEKAPVKKQGD
jgi:hypothetical protein